MSPDLENSHVRFGRTRGVPIHTYVQTHTFTRTHKRLRCFKNAALFIAMKAQRGTGCKAPHTLNLDIGKR